MIGPDYAAQNVGGGVTRTIYPLTENDQTDAEQTDTEEPMARPKHIHRWARGNVEEETELLLRSQVQVRLKPEDLRNVILIACVVVATIVDATPEIRVSHKKKHK